MLDRLDRGDLAGAVERYDGPLLPSSEAPLIVERRYHLDVALRTALLRRGTTAQLLRFADVHPADVEVLERAVAVAGPDDPGSRRPSPRSRWPSPTSGGRPRFGAAGGDRLIDEEG